MRSALTGPRSSVVVVSVVGIARPLGPFATAAVALRWFLREPFHALGSGWLGEDLAVVTEDGLRVRAALRDLRLRHAGGRQLGPLTLEPDVPRWAADLIDRATNRLFIPEWATWTEVAVRPGDRVQLVGGTVSRSAGDYRSAASDADATISAVDGPIDLMFL